MSREQIQEALRRQPFEPFAVHLSNGEIHLVENPEFAILMRSNLAIGDLRRDVVVIRSLPHIVSPEPVTNGQATG